MDGQADSTQNTFYSQNYEMPMSIYRYMALEVRNYPWKTAYVLSRNNLEVGWVPLREGFDPVQLIAAKISAFELALFRGPHSHDTMATRGYLKFTINGPAPPQSSLLSAAAAATKQMTSNDHGYARHRGNSLITSYRLLDVLAYHLGCHEGVARLPAVKPRTNSQPTHLMKKFGAKLCDIRNLLVDFRTAWKHKRDTDHHRSSITSENFDDLMLGYIKVTLDTKEETHAQKAMNNLLACALPLMVMSRKDSFPVDPRKKSKGPVPPELLEGLVEYIEQKYIQGNLLSQLEQGKVRKLFKGPNLRNMRRPLGVSVHVSPILNIAGGNLQKLEVTEDDMIMTSRLIGTHDVPLLDTIESRFWTAIWSIASGTTPFEAIDALVQTLPWNEIEGIADEDPINKRFLPDYPNQPEDDEQGSGRGSGLSRPPSDDENGGPPQPSPPASAQGAEDDAPLTPPPPPPPKPKVVKTYKTGVSTASVQIPSQIDEDIDILDPSLDFKVFITDTDWIFHDAQGEVHEFRPQFHREEILDTLFAIQEAITSQYCLGKPRYLHSPEVLSANPLGEKSVIMVVPSDVLHLQPAQDVQDLFAGNHILEISRPTEDLSFDLHTLSTATSLRRPIRVKDEAAEDYENKMRRCTLDALYKIRDAGRAVSTVELPRSCAVTLDVASFATDRRAYDFRRYCPEKDQAGRDRPFPFHQLEWSFVALKGATDDIRFSPVGSGCWVECVAGKVWYVLLRPKEDLDYGKMAKLGAFAEDKRLDDLILNDYEVEGVLLLPGNRLFIRPGTPYIYFVLENAVCRGGHFYAFSTMADTFAGIVHALGNPSFHTGDNNPSFRHLIRLLVQYTYAAIIQQEDVHELYRHVDFYNPLKDSDYTQLINLIAIIYTGILCNALDQDTYTLQLNPIDKPKYRERIAHARMDQYDYNAISHDDRVGCMFARGCAYELQRWFEHHYKIIGQDRSDIHPGQIVAYQAYVLIQQAKGASGNNQGLFNADAVQRQIMGTFRPNSAAHQFLVEFMEENASPTEMLFLHKTKIRRIKLLHQATAFQVKTMDEILAAGISSLDEKYKQGAACRFQVSLSDRIRRARKRQRTAD